MSSTQARHFEFVAFDSQLAMHWPLDPGGIYSDGAFTVLHIAPNRWVLIDPDTETIELLTTQVTAGRGALSNISGKWTAVHLTESKLELALSSGAAVKVFVRERQCALINVFDCPAIIARDGDSCRIWVQSSFADGFFDVIARCSDSPST